MKTVCPNDRDCPFYHDCEERKNEYTCPIYQEHPAEMELDAIFETSIYEPKERGHEHENYLDYI